MKKGLVQIIMESGGVFVTPGCGPCVGTHNGVPSDGEKVLSTANRNFKGRMGNNKAEIYLGSPATVAASVIEGKITDPRKYI
jgi:3-isopropylmalate/(R)-2-methylmalate dehydratase large subunit